MEQLYFTEAGITIAGLNEELDRQIPPVALKTMGGAGGQTIAGAISTGTHGGDFELAPLADSVRAIYLIGKAGIHHWIEPAEPSKRITDPTKIQATFPCIDAGNIHYNDDYFHAVLVSVGGMGVIYALILEVVPQYSLLHFNKWSTWEKLRRDERSSGFTRLFDGSWSGMTDILGPLGIENPSRNRFAQVAINPIRRADGEHDCYVSNRVEIPYRVAEAIGRRPLTDFTTIDPGQIRSAIFNDPLFDTLGFGLSYHFAGRPGSEDNIALAERVRRIMAFCKSHNYSWPLRAVINLIMQRTFPESGIEHGSAPVPAPRRPRAVPQVPVDRFLPEPGLEAGYDNRPQVDVAYKVMAPGGTTRPFTMLQVTSTEPAFSFSPRTGHPGADVIAFIDAVLNMFDQGMPPPAREGFPGRQDFDAQGRDVVFPVGYVTLRVTGKSDSLLGMQRFDRNGHVEVSMFGTSDGYATVRRVEQLALDMGGALHWGQSNGLMTFRDVEAAYGAATIARWQEIQRELGGDTFTNFFMRRCGLVPTPGITLDRSRIIFAPTPAGGVSRPRTFRITNSGTSPLQISLRASTSGNFQWGELVGEILPGGFEVVEVEFTPQSTGYKTATLSVQSNAPGRLHLVALEGLGLDVPPL